MFYLLVNITSMSFFFFRFPQKTGTMSSCRHGDLERRRTFLVNFPERAQHVICSLELIEICLVYVLFVRLYIIFICISRSILDGYFNPLVFLVSMGISTNQQSFFLQGT